MSLIKIMTSFILFQNISVLRRPGVAKVSGQKRFSENSKTAVMFIKKGTS